MFIDVSTLTGGQKSIRTSTIIRIRDAYGDEEPKDATLIEFGDERFFSADPMDTMEKKIGDALALARLTLPSGGPILIDADKATSISDPIASLHHPEAGSVIRIARRNQQVREKRAEARAIIESA